MTQRELAWAFIERTTRKEHVSFTYGDAPYLNVFGPSGSPPGARTAYVIIEQDGALSFRVQAVAEELNAVERPNVEHCGRAEWWLTPATLEERYGTARAVVDAVVHVLQRHGHW